MLICPTCGVLIVCWSTGPSIDYRCPHCGTSLYAGGTCTKCGGSGQLTKTCPTCNGSGKITKWITCPRCGGTGRARITCPQCAGKTTVVCPDCGGTGEIPEFTVELDASPKTGTFPFPLTVTFTGRITGYEDASRLQWLLDFKDGQVEWRQPPAPDSFTVEHTYENPGTYEVSLGSNDGITEGYDYVTITVAEEIPEAGWDVEVTVNLDVAREVRPAEAGEVEVLLEDIGEGLDYTVYNTTGWKLIGSGGKIRFSQSDYSWIVGFDGVFGSNRFYVHARLTADPSVLDRMELFLSTTEWA